MPREQIIVIDRVEELFEDKDGIATIIGRTIYDKVGGIWKVKSGRGGSLREKWDVLGNNIGKAFKLKIGQFKGYDYVEDFELVADVFIQEAAQKVQPQVSGQEIGLWWKEVGELIRAGIINKDSATGRGVIAAYYAQMFSVLGIKVSKGEKAD